MKRFQNSPMKRFQNSPMKRFQNFPMKRFQNFPKEMHKTFEGQSGHQLANNVRIITLTTPPSGSAAAALLENASLAAYIGPLKEEIRAQAAHWLPLDGGAATRQRGALPFYYRTFAGRAAAGEVREVERVSKQERPIPRRP